MGIIRKQSILSSLFIYIGFGIGALNTLYLFPHFLGPEKFGLTRLLVDVALPLALLCTMGSLPAIIKFFPFYKSYLSPKKNDLPFLTLFFCTVGCLLFLIITPHFEGIIIRKFGARSPLFNTYFNLIYPLTICYAFWCLLEYYSWSLQQTVLPSFLKEVGFRVVTTVFLLLFSFKIINFESFIHLFSFIYLLPVLILVYTVYKSDQIKINFSLSNVTRRLWKQISIFSLFVFSGQVLAMVARSFDLLVVASQSKGGLTDTAVYSIAMYFITLMDVPLRGMTGITTSIIAAAWKDRNMNKIEELYQKTALNLFIVGGAIWAIIMLNKNNIAAHYGSSYALIPQLLLILGLAKMIDLGTGLNAQILLSSKYWKIDFITSMFFIVLSIPLNIYLTKKYNMLGTATGSLIAFFCYNLVRYIFIWYLFKLQPFSRKNVFAFLIAAICFMISYLIPAISNIYLDIILRSLIFSVLYIAGILYFDISKDINDVVLIGIQKSKRILTIRR